MSIERDAYKNLQTKEVYNGRFIKVVDEQVQMTGIPPFWRETVLHNGAVVILPQVSKNELLMIRQYRHSVRETILELPAGTLELSEEPIDCAKREICEEVGHRALDWIELGTVYPTPGFCSEKQYCFLARSLEPFVLPGDEDEVIEVCRLSFEELEEKIRSGEIRDAKTIGVYGLAKLRGLL